MGIVSLSRNRDFRLLQTGRLLSGAGSEATTIAYPLKASARRSRSRSPRSGR